MILRRILVINQQNFLSHAATPFLHDLQMNQHYHEKCCGGEAN